jgi:tRNA 2-thiocytidine biosynthesis protein TtcA
MTLIRNKLFYTVKKLTGKAIGDFNLINDGDRIAVGVSGGKDSYSLLHMLDTLRRRAPVQYSLVAVNIDAGYPGYRTDAIEEHLKSCGFEYRMVKTDIYRIVETKRNPGTSYCSFCARLRRGCLYTAAQELGCNKLALGHHLDDFIETLLLNQFFVGTLAAMSPRMLADNGVQTVIRPFVYVEESAIAQFAAENRFTTVACACPESGSFDINRKRMKNLITELAREIPNIRSSMIKALAKVQPRYLMDGRFTPFADPETAAHSGVEEI